MYLLDTNVISELRRSKPHGAVLAWIAQTDDAALNLPAIALYELQLGVEKLRERDAKRASEIAGWIDCVATTMNVIFVDAKVARRLGVMMLGRPDHLIADAMIASTAQVHNLTLATRNVQDFVSFGIPVLNPFDFGRAV